MKKYKLLKDLPLYPAGTIGEIRKLDDGVESIIKVKNDILVEIINSVELRTIREEGKFDEWFEEIEESKAWKPKQGEIYYFAYSNGEVASEEYADIPIDRVRVEIGNCFKTEEEAEKTIEKLKALRRLREAGVRFDGWTCDCYETEIHITAVFDLKSQIDSQFQKDLDLLFIEEEK